MTPESRSKAQATSATKTKERDNQTIVINSKWKITRPDDYNWCIVRKGYEKEPWFYARLIDALQALPHKILDEQQLRALADILKASQEIANELEGLRFYIFRALNDKLRS